MTERGPGHSDANATYVFAVCWNPEPSALVGLRGVTDEAPVSTLPLETLTAIVQTVRARDFTDEAWQARLSDQRELERYARAHHDVVSAAAACCPTVPLPMATLYHGEQRARDALSSEADRFHTALQRIAHHAEWGVKVYAPPCPPDDSIRSATPAGRSRPAPGAGLAYLERKRGVQERRERSQDEALRVAESVDAEISLLAAASRRLRPHGQQLSGERRIQVLNATYLVAEHRAGELTLLAQSLRERTGVQIELSGPWVPYSFVGEV
ncbi:GvpL/GvpF family gas vesicle protein [Streptomyces sp. NBC_01571]|uniref:GvpL/GvpF family gas vesicle protein n=1 Tax=Streptomyces sp. NBC_01571 TaxID=2975883 RepID=UPI002257D667|nr:GvpL/GvpF family gas vesicle protein [Streptomyces sp. NBC_01571]MCX4578487.1 GvpL/GvpF family gas vesicle protein [Streptomyces sp. NBC_01571]